MDMLFLYAPARSPTIRQTSSVIISKPSAFYQLAFNCSNFYIMGFLEVLHIKMGNLQKKKKRLFEGSFRV